LELEAVGEIIDLDKIRKSWSALTHAVAQERISLATYLQEGFPKDFDGKYLIIGFPKGFEFYVETLEDSDNILLVEKILSLKLKIPIVVRYKMVEGQEHKKLEEEEPLVKKTLETFEGKIVDKWHVES